MGHPRIGQVIIPRIQLTLLSSAVREITNERVKLKYLTHKTEPLSFPKWNVMVADNQDKQMSKFHNLHFRDRLPQIYFSLLSLSLSPHPDSSPSPTSSIQCSRNIKFPPVEKIGISQIVWRSPMAWLQDIGPFHPRAWGFSCHFTEPLLFEEAAA